MDAIVDSIEKAYQEFVTAAAIVLETRETYGDQKTTDVDSAIKKLHERLVLFEASCDEAQGFVEYLKHSLGCNKFPGNLSNSQEQVFDDDHSDSLIQCNPIPIKAADEKLKTDASTSKP
ncbi:mediator of RNA polymerase II transcription subunit 32-like [Lycium ferocissimum]|uniref:mediator of RNA polymerase II transcription subunit 32-like n=1 Tax=Lycium ferocissimum TaxID=112874 RepID=UPI00281552BB|nr:mediator of RNA polymerase II transcription subunit 32-like [Lycium ferocissimum]XP_059318010.1 mediator of RNA polymerase II transcription subunit 32-like [Lycium ferocissimum]XP_059318018.1 mediator of RNA polymerase II transcription subunit 32-like [Lycium ferocissimum]